MRRRQPSGRDSAGGEAEIGFYVVLSGARLVPLPTVNQAVESFSQHAAKMRHHSCGKREFKKSEKLEAFAAIANTRQAPTLRLEESSNRRKDPNNPRRRVAQAYASCLYRHP